METSSQQKITLQNLDSFKYLDKNSVKLFVRGLLKTLPSYSVNEENVLISLATGLTLSQLILFQGFDRKLLKKIKRFLKLRLNNMPLNKIAKSTFFYTNKFYIDNSVLAPRKETELLVEKVIQYANIKKLNAPKILDLCCGSGAIGLSLARHIENSEVTLSDLSSSAVRVSKKNRKKLKLKKLTTIVKSDMFQGLKIGSSFDIIVSNPPYIKTRDINLLDESVKNYDPIIALDGGEDGLDFYRIIAKNAKNYLNKDGKIFMEIGFDQGALVKKLFEENGFIVTVNKDYSNLDRIVIANLK